MFLVFGLLSIHCWMAAQSLNIISSSIWSQFSFSTAFSCKHPSQNFPVNLLIEVLLFIPRLDGKRIAFALQILMRHMISRLSLFYPTPKQSQLNLRWPQNEIEQLFIFSN